jgi:hypothetical protein
MPVLPTGICDPYCQKHNRQASRTPRGTDGNFADAHLTEDTRGHQMLFFFAIIFEDRSKFNLRQLRSVHRISHKYLLDNRLDFFPFQQSKVLHEKPRSQSVYKAGDSSGH